MLILSGPFISVIQASVIMVHFRQLSFNQAIDVNARTRRTLTRMDRSRFVKARASGSGCAELAQYIQSSRRPRLSFQHGNR